jgi:SAM-dependent methyltransferase
MSSDGGSGAWQVLRAWLGLPIPLPAVHRARGNAWCSWVPQLRYLCDNHLDPYFSLVVIYEDGTPLAHPHAHHDEIVQLGQGKFVHWGDQLIFSTSDNSDPRENGRRYCYSRAWFLYRKAYGRRQRVQRSDPPRVVPVNFQLADARPAAIRDCIDFTLHTAEGWMSHAIEAQHSIRGATVLEVGPGPHFGTALLMACAGAERVVVIDPFLAPWEEHYHPAFYRALREAVMQRPQWSTAPLDKVLAAQRHEIEQLELLACSLESMAEVEDASIDMTFSNAVLEHSSDLPAAIDELARVTRPGGLAIHQVDHRDHRDFERPLEYLLLTEEEFEQLFIDYRGECGNRYRPDELRQLFASSGFEILLMNLPERAGGSYLNRTYKRLTANPDFRYHGMPKEHLAELSSFTVARRKAAP